MTGRRAALAAAAVVVTAGAAVAGLAHAREEVTVEGCYGAGNYIFCDVTVSYGEPASVRTSRSPFPVCAGSCETVNVPRPVVGNGEPLAPCVEWEGPAGSGECRYPEDQ